MIHDRERDPIGGRGLVPYLFQEGGVMGERDHLAASAGNLHDFVDCLPATEGILAVERIIEHNKLCRACGVALQVREKEGEGERRAVAGAQCVLEAWAIGGCLAIAYIDRMIVDDELVAR